MNKPVPVTTANTLDESFKVVFDTNSVPHLLLQGDSPVFTIVAVNQAYLLATNLSGAEIIGRSLFQVFPSKDQGTNDSPEDLLLLSLKKVVKEKLPQQMKLHEYDVYMTASDGSSGKYWNLVNRPILNKSGEVAYIIHTVSDVTAEMLNIKLHEEQQKTDQIQQQVIYNLFMQAPVASAIFRGQALTVEMVNDPMCALWGRSVQQVLGKDLQIAIPEVNEQGLPGLMQDVMRTGIPYIGIEMPTLIERKGIKETLYFNYIFQPLRERDGAITKVLMITTEVIEQASAKTDLQKSREHLNLALEFGNIGVWQYEFATAVTSYSQTAINLFGQSEHKNWNRKNFIELVYEEDKQNVLSLMDHAARSGNLSMTFRIKDGENSFSWLSMQGKTIYDNKNMPVRMLGLVSDITERKDEERRKDDFMGIVSHELKTPVTSMKAYGQILHGKFLEEGDLDSAHMLEKMDSQVNKLTSLISDLLDATRIEGGQLQFHEGNFSVNEMIIEVVEEVQRTSGKHILKLGLADDKILFGDRDRIGQVVTNLLTNAIKYSPGNKTISIESYIKGDSFVCCVADEGLGIPAECIKHLFDRYFRVQGGKRQTYPGLGLGLFISAEIIKRQDGKIWVESEEGKWSRFYFSLPLKRTTSRLQK